MGDTTRCGVEYIVYKTIPTCKYEEVIAGNITILKFNITNPQKMIIAATFEIETSNVMCGNINITSGRFDISDITQ